MIYLILDTNIWIYLANGFDPLTSKHSDDLHFELLASLKESNRKMEIKILVNEIIFNEWERNKEQCKVKIKKLESKLKNVNEAFGDIDRYAKTGNVKKEYVQSIKLAIKKNEEHLSNVESFLLHDCKYIPINDTTKIKVFDLSVSNKAPFHNKSNNVADASILLSATEFLKENLFQEEDCAIFVSSNFKDFTDGKNKDDFHPDIKELVHEISLRYQRVLPSALKLSKKLMIEIQKYLEQQARLDRISFDCQTPYCQGNENFRPFGYLSNEIKVRKNNEVISDPNQLNIFPSLPTPIKIEQKTSYGDCAICGTTHILCPDCEELFYIEDIEDEFYCSECGLTMSFEQDDKSGAQYLLVKRLTDENIED